MINLAKYEDWLTKEGLILIEGWARDGLSNEQIAHNMGINPDTLYTWKKQFPDFSEALKNGKEVVDRMVENALFKSAMGFEYEEETVTNKGDVVKVKKYERPNVTAQIFALKNRKPDVWRDRKEHDINTKVSVNDDMTPEEREQRIKELMNKVDSNKESGE